MIRAYRTKGTDLFAFVLSTHLVFCIARNTLVSLVSLLKIIIIVVVVIIVVAVVVVVVVVVSLILTIFILSPHHYLG
jgi:hypothetical protein